MIRKLTAAQLAGRPDYILFLQGLAVGEGGMASVAGDAIGRQSLKGRLSAAATAAGVSIRYRRSGADTVLFEIVGRDSGG